MYVCMYVCICMYMYIERGMNVYIVYFCIDLIIYIYAARVCSQCGCGDINNVCVFVYVCVCVCVCVEIHICSTRAFAMRTWRL